MSNYTLKKEYIMTTAKDIIEHIDNKYGVEVEIYDVAELINLNIGFLFDFNHKLIQEINNNEDTTY